MIEEFFAISKDIRYVAIYEDDKLEMRSRPGTEDASSADTDRYEELLVNPTLLKLASQRGNIDCGGLNYLLIRYGNFFQFVQQTERGHVSVCIDKNANAVAIAEQVSEFL